MGYPSLRACVEDLQHTKQLIVIEEPVDPYLEVAEIQRRVYQAGGPAIYYANVKGCGFPLVSNLFGTKERAEYLFRDALQGVRQLVELKADPERLRSKPWKYLAATGSALASLPKYVKRGPVMENTTTISALPQIQSWPQDGGAFITLPQVYTEDPRSPGVRKSNLGMYRVQLSGNQYQPDAEIGLHYQIHRGIGVHHAAAIEQGKPLKVNIFVGGPPAMTVAAVMPLPEGLPELFFAGGLGNRRIRLIQSQEHLVIPADVDFCICGWIDPKKELPEGPFGDHLGYYSLAHPFPVMRVEKVYHRSDAIWPFTTVGRPPQEDTTFGEFIHELTGPALPAVLPGVHEVHAVDAAGVHPLLLAIGSERYVPYRSRERPEELLTQANAILGQGQLSLAKYLLIVAKEDNPELDIHHVDDFFQHLLQRIDWQRDVHFQTCTTIDTLDYSGEGFNQGSKVVLAAVGEPIRALPQHIPANVQLPSDFSEPRVVMPGVLAVQAPKFTAITDGDLEPQLQRFCEYSSPEAPINRFPLIVLVDDSEFAARNLNNFLWTTFTRSNPAVDIHGIGAFLRHKHWGCRGSLVIDARWKPQMAPPLIEDPEVTKRVDALAAPGKPLHGIL